MTGRFGSYSPYDIMRLASYGCLCAECTEIIEDEMAMYDETHHFVSALEYASMYCREPDCQLFSMAYESGSYNRDRRDLCEDYRLPRYGGGYYNSPRRGNWECLGGMGGHRGIGGVYGGYSGGITGRNGMYSSRTVAGPWGWNGRGGRAGLGGMRRRPVAQIGWRRGP